MTIRDMKEEDLDKIMEYGADEDAFRVGEESCFWEREALRRGLKSPLHVLTVYEQEGEITGFLLGRYDPVFDKAEVENLYVKPELRRAGIGDELLKDGLKRFREMGAGYACALVKVTNENAQKFFSKHGSKGEDFSWIDL